MQFRGIYAPLTTPFDHQGRVYWSKFDFNLGQLQRTQLSGFVVADNWGEGSLLAEREKIETWHRAVTQSNGKADILAAISGTGVAVTRELLSAAAAAGCAAAIVEAPNTDKLAPGSETADLFFRSIADATTMPLFVSTRLDGADVVDTARLARLAAHPRIFGTAVCNCNPASYERPRRSVVLNSPSSFEIWKWLSRALQPGPPQQFWLQLPWCRSSHSQSRRRCERESTVPPRTWSRGR